MPEFLKKSAASLAATAIVLLAGPQLATAASACPSGGDDWTASCFTQQAGQRYVKRQYLGRLKWDRQGYALVSRADAFELVAVNRQGKVVVPGIYHTGDFDYPDAERGVGRFAMPDGKCGYFQASGFKIVVPARYDVCQAFHDGAATACTDCTRYCDDEDCHMDHLVGGQADQLALDGTVRQTYTLATLDTICGSPERRKLIQRAGTPLLQCVRDPGPFDHLR